VQNLYQSAFDYEGWIKLNELSKTKLNRVKSN
jgi:hypothetical protein